MTVRRVDREPVPGYPHPSAAAYRAGCGCNPCHELRYRTSKRLRVYGTGLRDSEPIRDRIRDFTGEGFSIAAVAQAAGLPDKLSTFCRLEKGKVNRVNVDYTAVLGLTRRDLYDRVSDQVRVPAVGATRRLRALAVMGWPSDIATESGFPPRLWRAVRTHPTDGSPAVAVSADTWRKVTAVYDRLGMTPGPSQRARVLAAQQRWDGPLAWDENIDDPAAVPDRGATAGDRYGTEAFLEDVRWFLGSGMHPEAVCDRMGVSAGGLRRRLERRGHPELAARFGATAEAERNRREVAA